jgi:hypothetical protein
MGLIVREKQDVQATAEAYTSCGSLVWPHKVMKENKKFDGLNQHPYRQRNLEDQAGHAILAKEKITQSTCQPAHLDNLWQVPFLLYVVFLQKCVCRGCGNSGTDLHKTACTSDACETAVPIARPNSSLLLVYIRCANRLHRISS